MNRSQKLGAASAALSALALAGCATTRVQTAYERTSAAPPPSVVLVYRFAVNADEVTENQGFFSKVDYNLSSTPMDERKRQTAQEAADRLANDLVTGIRGLGVPAELATGSTVAPPQALMLSGAFMDLDEGNRLQRMVIGLGAGQSKIATRFQLVSSANGTYQTLARFETHANSGEMPGAAITMGAGAAAQGGATAGMAAANVAASGVKAYRTAMDPMLDRTADKAIVTLSQYFGSQGWIPPDKVKTNSWGGL